MVGGYMLKNEIIKILGNKSFLIFLLIAMLINGGLIYWQQIQTDEYSSITYKEYRQLGADIARLSDNEKQIYISQQIEQLQLIGRFEAYLSLPDMYADFLTEEEIESIEDVYASGEYLRYTGNIYDEICLYEEVLTEVQETLSYEKVLENIKKNSKRILKRLEEGTFEYERAEKTIETYGSLDGVELHHQTSRGVNLFFDNVTTDLIVMICILFGTIIVITYEREKNLIILSKTTKNGRAYHATIKALALMVIGVVVTLLLYGETLLLAENIYGLGDLTRPIQSVTGYSLCALGISIGQYIGIYVFLKFLFFFMCAALFFLVSSIFRRAISVYLVSGTIVGALMYGYNAISDTSYLLPFKTFNPVSFGQTEQILSRFQCVEIMGHAYEKLTVYVVCMIMLICVMFVCGICIYAISNEKEIARFEGIATIRREHYHTSMLRHEFYKSFIAYRVAFIHIIGLVVAYMVFIPASERSNYDGNYHYDMYASSIEGVYTEETDEYIQNQMEFVEGKLEEYSNCPSSNEYLNYELAKSALQKMNSYADYLSRKEGSYYLNNDGYIFLTGGTSSIETENIILAIMSALFTIVCLTSSISADYSRGEDRLIKSTLYGKRRYALYKYIIGLSSVVVIYATFWLPQLTSILNKYGTNFFNAPAYSLEHLHKLPQWVSIGMYIVFIYVIRFVALLVIMVVSSLLVKKLRSNALSILIATAIFIGPVVLYFLGVEEMRYLTLFWL